MTEPRLTKQQQRRIAAAQAEKSSDGTESGLVIARFGKRILVEDTQGRQLSCTLRRRVEDPVAGDQVIWRRDGEAGVIEALAPRSSVIQRPNSQGKLRPIAANLDRVLIVVAPEPEPSATLIDRYLVAAHHAGIEPVLVINKMDLLPPSGALPDFINLYRGLGYTVIETDRDSDPKGARLLPVISNATLVLVGQSGVGKSSIVKRLLPEEDIRIGSLSTQGNLGRHTTTTAALYHLPNGGQLVDSPGVREFHLNHLPRDTISGGFPEFATYLGSCRFRDCRHQNEAGCAVLQAAAQGRINAGRLASFHAILGA